MHTVRAYHDHAEEKCLATGGTSSVYALTGIDKLRRSTCGYSSSTITACRMRKTSRDGRVGIIRAAQKADSLVIYFDSSLFDEGRDVVSQHLKSTNEHA
ncbi:hypothetical protein MRB53_036930 [Persea americana]|nr:hypothetical protein MRB53_036930 [Persea americana]